MKINPRHKASFVFSISMVVICVVTAIYAGRWLLAEYYTKAAMKQMEVWDDVNYPVFPEDWYAVLEYLDRAVELNPNYANIHFLQGQAYELGQRVILPRDESLSPADQLNAFISTRVQFSRQALAAYSRSVVLRPLDMYAWLEITRIKGGLEEFDDEFYYAYKKTMILGKDLEYFQTNLSLVSSGNFPAIQRNEEAKNLQLEHFAKVLNGNTAREHIKYLQNEGFLGDICSQLSDRNIEWNFYMQGQCDLAGQVSDTGIF